MKVLIVTLSLLVLSACGVKGSPQPPLVAPPIGRGQPTMKQDDESVQVNPLIKPFLPEAEQEPLKEGKSRGEGP